MNITSNINHTDLIPLIINGKNQNHTLTIISTTTTTIVNTYSRLFNSTKIYPILRSSLPTTSISSILNEYFIFNSVLQNTLRLFQLFILGLTLTLYAIIFILFIQLTIYRINKYTVISGGRSRTQSQRRRERMHSLIWTLNYLLVDVLNLLNEMIYLVIHLVGLLSLKSRAGRFYCQLQIYLPLYLTVLMAYSLTAVSIYRRRHFANLKQRVLQSNMKIFLMISALWIIPLITSILPTFLLIYLNILKITQHETTNQCQISYTYESNIEAIYICYRLGNIFLLPISISLVCYIAIYVDLLRMQRRFSREVKRHVLTRKNLTIQILFLFLNFAVFWLPAEMIMLYTKDSHLKDALQVTKSLNILLDPVIIAIYDTRFKSAAKQLISICPFNEFIFSFLTNRGNDSSLSVQTTIRYSDRSRQMTKNTDDTSVLEVIPNHSSQRYRTTQSSTQHHSIDRRRKSIENTQKEIVDIHV